MEIKNEKDLKQLIKTIVAKNCSHLSPEEIKMQEEVLEKIYIEGKKPYEAMGISKNTIEYLYTNAFNLYNAGQYDAAIKIFYVLENFDPGDSRFQYGIGACHHMAKRYNEATVGYNRCLFLPPVNPMVYYHLADCYLKAGRKREALAMLGICVKATENDLGNIILRTRAQQAYDALDKEVDEEIRKVLKKQPIESGKG